MGVNFHDACTARGRGTSRPRRKVLITALCPMIVCYAFAAELYRQSLIKRPINNHRLNVLVHRTWMYQPEMTLPVHTIDERIAISCP